MCARARVYASVHTRVTVCRATAAGRPHRRCGLASSRPSIITADTAREKGGGPGREGWREGGTRRRDAAIRDSGKGRRASVGDGLARARARAHARSGQRNFVIGAPFKPRNSATPGVETGLVVDPAHSCPFLFLFSSVPPSPSFSQFWLLTEN